MISIKKLSIKDIEIAKELFTFFQSNDGISNPFILAESKFKAMLSDNNFHVFVAIKGTELLGGLTAFQLDMYKAIPAKILLYEIAVELNHRRQGIGKKLIQELTNYSETRGINKILVLTTTDNTEAIAFYKATNGNLENNQVCFSYSI